MSGTPRRIASSFRDPSGFLFFRNGVLLRQVNRVYAEDYDSLMASGLYESLVDRELLIPHQEIGLDGAASDGAHRVLRPQPIPFISYPYEWSFSQLRGAALTTLAVQKRALECGMTLKDASAYNIQFLRGRPIFIDTLSFERYEDGTPWMPYRQFCQHFLAPLALMAYRDIHLNSLLRLYIDGVPLDLASRLLPGRTRLRFLLLAHIHLHARSQARYADKPVNPRGRSMGRMALQGLINSLETACRKLHWSPTGTEWAEYYDDTNYSRSAMEHKQELVAQFVEQLCAKVVWDLGANTGIYSRIASKSGAQTISFDIDPAAVEKNYLHCRATGEEKILPLVLDLTNPSPGIGWANTERMSILERGPADAVLALALIHHLAISNNLPLGHVAELFASMCQSLIIEFIPKSDSQVQRLLATREDIFPRYTQEDFEKGFGALFHILRAERIRDSQRSLYLMRKA
jgi:hypothetical protein